MTAKAAASPWAVFGLTAIAVFLVSVDGTIVLAAFPALRDEFAATSPARLSWVLNGYTIVYAALLVPAGRWADTTGRRRVFLAGLALFGLASALCGLAATPAWLVAARVVQAAGAAMLTPASLALILAAFPAARRAVAVSLWGAVGALAAAVGPAVGGWLVDLAGWRAVFLVNLPIVLIALWRARVRLLESRSPEPAAAPDWLGIALLIGGVGAIVLGIVEADHLALGEAAGISTAGLALLLGFVAWARGRPGAALDLSLFAEPSYGWVNAASLVFGAAFTMMFLGFFLYLTAIWHYSLTQAGLAVTPGPLAVIPVAILGGRLAGRMGHRPLLVAGGVLFALSQLWFLLALDATPDFLRHWLPRMLLGGVSVGLVLPALGAAAAARLGPRSFGAGNAANAAFRQVGSAFGAAGVVLLAGHAEAGLAEFDTVFKLLIVGGLLTALLCLPVDTRPRGSARGEAGA